MGRLFLKLAIAVPLIIGSRFAVRYAVCSGVDGDTSQGSPLVTRAMNGLLSAVTGHEMPDPGEMQQRFDSVQQRLECASGSCPRTEARNAAPARSTYQGRGQSLDSFLESLPIETMPSVPSNQRASTPRYEPTTVKNPYVD